MSVFDGIVACVSGAFSCSQQEMKDMLIDNGAKIVGSVTNACNLLVASEIGTSKYTTAVSKGINIVTEDWVNRSIEDAKQSDDSSLFLHQASGSSKPKAASKPAAKAPKAKKKKEESEDEESEEEESEEEEVKKKPTKKAVVAKKSGGDVFKGVIACVSGRFSVPQAEMQNLLQNGGAKIVQSVTNACNLLVASEVGTSKFNTAVDKGVKVVTEAWVNESLEAGSQSTDASLILHDPSSNGNDDEEEEEAPKPAPKPAAKPARGKKRKAEEEPEEEPEEEEEPETKKPAKKASASKKVFSGLSFCVSGHFSVSQNEMKAMLTNNGGKICSTVNSSCDCLVASEIGTTKFNTAKGKGIPIVTESWVQHCIEKGEVEWNGDDDLFLEKGSVSSSSSSSSSSRASKKKSQEEEDDDDDSVEVQSKSRAAKKQKSESSSSSSSSSSRTERTMVIKGKAPVDEHVPIKGQVHVYVEGDEVFDCMMNQTNTARNNNKFYVVQLLESDAGKTYWVWNRWGRNGMKGQVALKEFGSDLNSAKKEYRSKIHDKSVKGDYKVIARDFGGEDDEVKEDEEKKDGEDGEMKDELKASTLPKPTQDLLSLIFSNSLLQQTLKEMKYDAAKMPLGRLSRAQIEKGYTTLKEISEILKSASGKSKEEDSKEEDSEEEDEDEEDEKEIKPKSRRSKRGRTQRSGRTSGPLSLTSAQRKLLRILSDDYYTDIPHIAPSMRTALPIIESEEQLENELDLLDSLLDAKELQRITKASHDKHSTQNMLDRHYDGLQCNLRPLDKSGNDKDVYQLLNTYLQQTHAPTHRNYSLKLMDVFEVDRDPEFEPFQKKQQEILSEYDQANNPPLKQLLWHGSRVTNFAGILSQGLRIAPPEAPVTGYMFGKGVYFANMSSKSANYCNTTRQNNTGLLLLCEVLTGNVNQLKQADYDAADLPQGKHSTHGVGKTAPDASTSCFHPDSPSLYVPCGKPKPTGHTDSSLLYDEFIVYSTQQVKMKYLLKVQFDYDDIDF